MANVMAIGSGLISGRTNMANDFTVYHNGKGYGGLSVAVEGPSKSDIRYSDNHDGSVKVHYTPSIPGEYKINVKYDGFHLRGSPYTVMVRGEDLSVGHTATVSTPLAGYGSPYSRHSPQRHSVANVRVSGRGLYSGISNVQNEITVDVRDAGSGRLHYSIEGPGNVESKNHGLFDGYYRIYYRPDRSGEYKITIRYNDLEVLGSPFKVRVV